MFVDDLKHTKNGKLRFQALKEERALNLPGNFD